jgi:hypothetical protein
MSNELDIKKFVFAQDDLPEEGANIRVRPEPVRPKVYGQGIPLKGPKINEVVFTWGAPYLVDSTCDPSCIGNPESGKIHPDVIINNPELFMSEAQYQNYITQKLENNE